MDDESTDYESRACAPPRLLPAERLEANLLLGGDAAVRALIRDEEPGIAEQRQAYLYGGVSSRDQALVRELQARYHGRCQLCLWDPVDRFGHSLCHGHHIQWLSRGGESTEENMILLCPNDHAAIHRCDAPLD